MVLLGYAVLAGWITHSWWAPLGGRVTAVNEPDAVLFSWLLTWTPHALGTGQWPLYSDALNAPTGIHLMWNNGMALPAVLFAPLTAALGGLATVTVLTTLGLAGTAATTFGCLRAMGVRRVAAGLGGLLGGFSPAMLAQAVGAHPNLVFNLLAPVLLLLAARVLTVTDPAVRRRSAVLLGVAAGLQVLVGEEVLFLAGVVVALLLIVLVVSAPRVAVRRAGGAAGGAAVAFAVFLLVAGVPLGYQLFGPLPQEGSPFLPGYYSVDLANVVTPTPVQALVPAEALARSAQFAGGLEERTAFLGWPVLVLVVVALVALWRDGRVRTTLLVGLACAVCSLGPELVVDGEDTGIALPWALPDGLPGFEHVLTTRFALYTGILIGAGLALALDRLLARIVAETGETGDTADRETAGGPARAVVDADEPDRAVVGTASGARSGRAPGRRRTGGLLAVAAVAVVVGAAVVPLAPAPFPGQGAPVVPAFFTGDDPALDCPGTVLVLPFPRPTTTDAMAWQSASGMRFAMPGGYFIGPADDGRAYIGGQPSVTGTLLQDVAGDGVLRDVTPQVRTQLRADLTRWGTCAVVLGPPRRHGDALLAQTVALLGTTPEFVDGVAVWRDPLAGLPD